MNQTSTVKNRSNGPVNTATALSANADRLGFFIQNNGTSIMYVKLGSSASTTSYDIVLAKGTAASDGTGGIYQESSSILYTGIVTIASANSNLPYYTAFEI